MLSESEKYITPSGNKRGRSLSRWQPRENNFPPRAPEHNEENRVEARREQGNEIISAIYRGGVNNPTRWAHVR